MGIATYRNVSKFKNEEEYIIDKNNHKRGRLKIRPKKKRFKKEDILKEIRIILLKDLKKEYGSSYFAEDFALQFEVPCHIIEQIFSTLNKEGLLTLPSHRPPEEGFRYNSNGKRDWMASKYYLRHLSDMSYMHFYNEDFPKHCRKRKTFNYCF